MQALFFTHLTSHNTIIMTSVSTSHSSWNRLFWIGRILLWSLFCALGARLAFSFAFPSAGFSFDFRNPGAAKNTIMNPRTNTNDPRGNGRVKTNETLLFDASPFGNFSTGTVEIQRENMAASTEGGIVIVRKSQKAFFLPEGAPAPFPAGSLVRHGEQFFLIANDGTWRIFANETHVRDLGYDPNAFLQMTEDDFLTHQEGTPIEPGTLPNGALIVSNGNFYELQDGSLTPFSSREAFLAAFPESWALQRSDDFVKSFPPAEQVIGFPSSSLLAFADGVFIMDSTTPRAIGSVDIFTALGYNWGDVFPASDEDISLSQKGKIVDFGTPHPNGTVLFDTDTNRYFLILNNEKRLIMSDTIRDAWLRGRHPVAVSSQSLSTTTSCILGKESWFSKTSSCTVSLDAFRELPGNSYEISLKTPSGTDIREATITFGSSITKDTLLFSLSRLKQRIFSRYESTP